MTLFERPREDLHQRLMGHCTKFSITATADSLEVLQTLQERASPLAAIPQTGRGWKLQ